MRIEVFKTYELTDKQWGEIVVGFNQNFNTNKTIEGFKAYYTSTSLDYSIHAIALDEDTNKIVGYNSIIPMKYLYNNDKEVIVGLSGGTYVLKEYRKDIFIFYDMIIELKNYCRSEGYLMTLGVSNENSYEYAIKFNGDKLAGFLPYYILPVNVFRIVRKPKFHFIDYLLRPIVWLYVFLNLIITFVFNSKENRSLLELEIYDDFYNKRFNHSRYKEYRTSKYHSYFSNVDENGIKTTYLFDFRENGERSSKSLIKTVISILSNHKTDIIIFVGRLNFIQFSLIKVPSKYEPQKLPLTYTLLQKDNSNFVKKTIDLTDINFGLINFDVR